MTNTVELENVCKSYDHFVAVDKLSLHVRAGSVYGLLGPNGAGKTSTLRMMIGITVPDSGAIASSARASVVDSCPASAIYRKSAACTSA
jgi:ABC-type multidrug transport system ATPase subunit